MRLRARVLEVGIGGRAPAELGPFHSDRSTKTEVNTLGAEHFTFGAGTDITELLHGLDGDARQSPHWGYVVQGAITALYTGGEEETSRTGDLFYWLPGHSVRAEEDTDIVMFSPQKEHGEVIEHIRGKVGD